MFLGLITYPKLIFVCGAVFLAGFIDSIAGGGGVISIPAFLLSGLDPKVACACGKTSACMGTTLAAGRYIKNKSVNWTAAIPSAIAALVGARIASLVVLALDPTMFQKLILFVLPFVAVFLIFIYLNYLGIIYREQLMNCLMYLTTRDYILLLMILLVMAVLIAGRFMRSIFKSSAMGAYREEA